VFPTTDDLLVSWPPLLAGKTGHTQDAGWSEAAAATAGGITEYASVLGSDSRASRYEALRDLPNASRIEQIAAEIDDC
jgi:D-alanyl-D-alanine carboxypeptidase